MGAQQLILEGSLPYVDIQGNSLASCPLCFSPSSSRFSFLKSALCLSFCRKRGEKNHRVTKTSHFVTLLQGSTPVQRRNAWQVWEQINSQGWCRNALLNAHALPREKKRAPLWSCPPWMRLSKARMAGLGQLQVHHLPGRPSLLAMWNSLCPATTSSS